LIGHCAGLPRRHADVPGDCPEPLASMQPEERFDFSCAEGLDLTTIKYSYLLYVNNNEGMALREKYDPN
jgi:hypothetical protein